jgi:thiosulfate/3-mercaptopyruvate sulfurtransferase
VAAALRSGEVVIDARVGERYRGETEPIDPVAGHIPGARSRPATDNLAADGTFLAPDVLRAGFARAGVETGVQVGAYCGSGVVAAQLVLAIELAGYRAALYPGSWSEWIADPDRQIATGSTDRLGS